MKVGACYLGNHRCRFTVWAPDCQQLAVKITSSSQQYLPMEPVKSGYWEVVAEQVSPGSRYFYELDGDRLLPDPASQSQPDGVHEASEVCDHSAFCWADADWSGVPLEDLVIYELHIGAFTPEGTFAAVIDRLPRLKELGITAIEIMPVAQFPGDRNWGYDGVYPYAVQQSYGGIEGLKSLVDACHQQGIAAILDVVYNHLGPEGNYLGAYAPYFTDKYRTPWGDAINFDDAYSDEVRSFFIENALYWLREFHFDGLRLDAVHGILDFGTPHFLAELADRVDEFSQQQGRPVYLIAESDLNDVRVIQERDRGGYGIDAQWSDDFHHALHALITGEQQSYYEDFGFCGDLAKAYKEGFIYSGQYAPFRKRRHGSSAADQPASRFVVCAQNHDQVGNRATGERLSHLASFEGLKLAAGAMLLSPFIPLLFMGEEYGEEAPFPYFISHSDPDLIRAVQEGRKAEFPDAGWSSSVPDPQAEETFQSCKLNWHRQHSNQPQVLWKLYQHLIQLRRTHPILKQRDNENLNAFCREEDKLLFVHRYSDDRHLFYVMNFSDRPVTFKAEFPVGEWQKLVDSADVQWMGAGAMLPDVVVAGSLLTISAHSFVLYSHPD